MKHWLEEVVRVAGPAVAGLAVVDQAVVDQAVVESALVDPAVVDQGQVLDSVQLSVDHHLRVEAVHLEHPDHCLEGLVPVLVPVLVQILPAALHHRKYYFFIRIFFLGRLTS